MAAPKKRSHICTAFKAVQEPQTGARSEHKAKTLNLSSNFKHIALKKEDMPDYKPKLIDPEDYEMMKSNNGKPFPKSDYRMEQWEWDWHLKKLNVYSPEQFAIYLENLKSQFADRESNWYQKILGQLWYKLILPKSQEYLTPKKLVWILTKLDNLLPYVSNDLAKTIIRTLDKGAEILYKML